MMIRLVAIVLGALGWLLWLIERTRRRAVEVLVDDEARSEPWNS